jgi:hypothetical protein
MPKKLVIVNALLIVIAAGSVLFIVRHLMAPMPLPVAARRPPATNHLPAAEEPRSRDAGAYSVVAARNLFSPMRMEAPASGTAATASPVVKPNLYGVVLREGAPIAYLEDPTTKRVAAYRVGDNVSGGTVQTIRADSVVINRPDGALDVRLRDPARPRPAPVPAAAVGVQPVQPAGTQPALPGVIPPAAAAVPPAVPVTPQPGVVPPAGQAMQPVRPSVIPGRRPLPPNLLRRLPQGQPPDAPQP